MIRELDSRISDGIYVRLLWHPDNFRVSITVDDVKTGQAFELGVREGERALDVYHHPYAYADERRNASEASSARLPSGRRQSHISPSRLQLAIHRLPDTRGRCRS